MPRRPASPRAPVPTFPLFRAGVTARLAAALGLSGLLWAAILWAGA